MTEYEERKTAVEIQELMNDGEEARAMAVVREVYQFGWRKGKGME